MMIKAVSFDIYNTIIDLRLDEQIWDLAIPSIYAREHNIPFDEAYSIVTREYALFGISDIKNRDIEFYFKHLKLKTRWTKVFDEIQDLARTFVFDDALKFVKDSQGKYKFVIITAEKSEYAKQKLIVTHLFEYFSDIISTHDYGELKKTQTVYHKTLLKLGVSKDELVHVGDNKEFDYAIPRQMGIRSFLLDRTGYEQGPDVVRNITEVKRALSNPQENKTHSRGGY
jgi:putative hydrolase of the HAD superfamily